MNRTLKALLPLARSGVLAALCLCLLWLAAQAAETTALTPAAAPEEMERVRELFERLGEGFRQSNARLAKELFTAEDQTRRSTIRSQLELEFAAERYTRFEILSLDPIEKTSTGHLRVWARMEMEYESRKTPGLVRKIVRNESFKLERMPDGRFAFYDSEFFDLFGRWQDVNLLPDVLLSAVLSLAALAFWAWMIYEAFTIRPKRRPWRWVVCLLPVAGAVAFFIVILVPAWRLARVAATTAPSSSSIQALK